MVSSVRCGCYPTGSPLFPGRNLALSGGPAGCERARAAELPFFGVCGCRSGAVADGCGGVPRSALRAVFRGAGFLSGVLVVGAGVCRVGRFAPCSGVRGSFQGWGGGCGGVPLRCGCPDGMI